MATIALDFDGVLSRPHGDPVAPPGPPLPHAREFIGKLQKKGLEVVIFSSREKDTIVAWLTEHGFPPLQIYYKPPVVALIDDRAVRFHGRFDSLMRAMWQPPWWQDHSQQDS